MIIANEKVRLHCDEPGCTNTLVVSLILLPTGGWGVHFPASAVNKWRLLLTPSQPMTPYKGCCPTHNQSRIVLARPGEVSSA